MCRVQVLSRLRLVLTLTHLRLHSSACERTDMGTRPKQNETQTPCTDRTAVVTEVSSLRRTLCSVRAASNCIFEINGDRSLEMTESETMSDGISQAQLQQLATRGFVSLNINSFPSLEGGYADLFEISSRYFALPAEDESKRQYRAASGSGASEEGHSVIPGEKQIFTCRGYHRTPASLRDGARTVWEMTGALLEGVMTQISDDLQLPKQPFKPLLGECLRLQQQRTPTLLRLFRYDRPKRARDEEESSQVVAERHRDLGLLSIVVGSSPGLEVFDEHTNEWISIEEPHSAQTEGVAPLTITLLTGQCLRYLTRGQYRAGIHRVRCSSRTNVDGSDDPFRYSIVYALRPFPSVLNFTDFECPRVGRFTEEEKAGVDGEPARKLFDLLCGKHFNVNIARDIREQQRITTAQMNNQMNGTDGAQVPSQSASTSLPNNDAQNDARTALASPHCAVQSGVPANRSREKKKSGWLARTWQKVRPSSRELAPSRVTPQSS